MKKCLLSLTLLVLGLLTQSVQAKTYYSSLSEGESGASAVCNGRNQASDSEDYTATYKLPSSSYLIKDLREGGMATLNLYVNLGSKSWNNANALSSVNAKVTFKYWDGSSSTEFNIPISTNLYDTTLVALYETAVYTADDSDDEYENGGKSETLSIDLDEIITYYSSEEGDEVLNDSLSDIYITVTGQANCSASTDGYLDGVFNNSYASATNGKPTIIVTEAVASK